MSVFGVISFIAISDTLYLLWMNSARLAAGHFIFTISGNRFGYTDQLFHIVIMLLEKVKDGIVVLAMP